MVELRTDDASEYTIGQELTADVRGGCRRGCDRHQQGQGQRRCDEAARLPRPARLARCAPQAPLAGFDRWLRHPGRVFKGPRMAGSYGVRPRDDPGLTVHSVDAERNLILVKGAVPGPKGALVLIRDAAKGA